MRRETLETSPPFDEEISYLALIMAETGRSGHDAGLYDSGICPFYQQNPERFPGEILQWQQIRDQGLIIGDFCTRRFLVNHSCDARVGR
jgi:hypothetical protein